jgi:hypothetical protein
VGDLDALDSGHEVDPVFAGARERRGGGKTDGGQQNRKFLQGGTPFPGGWVSAVLRSGTISSEVLMEAIVALSAGRIRERRPSESVNHAHRFPHGPKRCRQTAQSPDQVRRRAAMPRAHEQPKSGKRRARPGRMALTPYREAVRGRSSGRRASGGP